MGIKSLFGFGQARDKPVRITVMVSIRSISDEAPAERASMK